MSEKVISYLSSKLHTWVQKLMSKKLHTYVGTKLNT
jgi:hypothetical protein